MKTQERVEIVAANYPHPNSIWMILLLILASLAVGLIPIVYGLGFQESTDTTPPPATLWSELGRTE